MQKVEKVHEHCKAHMINAENILCEQHSRLYCMKFLVHALALYWLTIMDNFSKNLCGKKVIYIWNGTEKKRFFFYFGVHCAFKIDYGFRYCSGYLLVMDLFLCWCLFCSVNIVPMLDLKKKKLKSVLIDY
jgi:hypothetical protein